MGDKQVWSNEHLKCLLDTCIEEVNKVGRKGCSLQKESWVKLGKVLKDNFGLEVTQKQMKNAFDYLKAKYVGWKYLRNKTGNIYNPQTNTFALMTQEWDDFKKGHPKAGSLRTHPLPYPDLCEALYYGTSASGSMKWTPTQTTSMGASSSVNRVNHVRTLQISDNSFDGIEDNDATFHQTNAADSDASPNPPPDASPTDASSNPPPDASPNPTPAKRAKTAKKNY